MILDILNKLAKEVFNRLGYDANHDLFVTESDRPEISDYQCNAAFKLSKQYKKNPLMIAKEFLSELEKDENANEMFSKIEIANPGFINFSLSDNFINNKLNEMNAANKYNVFTSSKKIVIDYGGPNVAKPLHVGHLRSAIVGEAIKRIMQYAGDRVIGDVHLGDFGLQIGQVIYGIRQSGKNLDELTIGDLDLIYPAVSSESKINKTVNEECASITKQLQEGNEEYLKYWKKILELSKADIKNQYDYLDVNFELWEGESDAYEIFPALTKILKEKNLLEESEGALVVKVSENDEMPPLIYQKSNGAYLYGSTDLATVKKRYDKYKPNEIIYVTDSRQSLHFKQVFKAAEMADIAPLTAFTFCGFGTVNGLDGKPFRTREGSAPKLTSLFVQIKEILKQKEQNLYMSEEDLNILVNATIKFADLQNNREKDYIFDIEKFSNISGKTGPYILYTCARLKSLINEEDFEKSGLSNNIYNESDRQLRLQLLKFPAAFKNAYAEKMPSIIAEYLYNLCNCSNTFYETNRIRGNSNNLQKNDWCNLILKTTDLIKDISNLLIINQPKDMSKKK